MYMCIYIKNLEYFIVLLSKECFWNYIIIICLIIFLLRPATRLVLSRIDVLVTVASKYVYNQLRADNEM